MVWHHFGAQLASKLPCSCSIDTSKSQNHRLTVTDFHGNPRLTCAVPSESDAVVKTHLRAILCMHLPLCMSCHHRGAYKCDAPVRASRRDFKASCIHPWASRRPAGGILKSPMASSCCCCCRCWGKGGVFACSCITTYSRLRHVKPPPHLPILDTKASHTAKLSQAHLLHDQAKLIAHGSMMMLANYCLLRGCGQWRSAMPGTK